MNYDVAWGRMEQAWSLLSKFLFFRSNKKKGKKNFPVVSLFLQCSSFWCADDQRRLKWGVPMMVHRGGEGVTMPRGSPDVSERPGCRFNAPLTKGIVQGLATSCFLPLRFLSYSCWVKVSGVKYFGGETQMQRDDL